MATVSRPDQRHVDAAGVLRSCGVRSTRQRLAILEVLEGCSAALSAQEVHDRLRRGGEAVSLTTVYRNLLALEQVGILHLLARDGEHTYHRCASTPHHHLHCIDCGKVEEVVGRDLDAALAEVVERFGFAPEEGPLEVRGHCGDCGQPA